MILPTEQQCLDYFIQYKVPLNIKTHCLKVRDVAVFLAQKLKDAGEEVDLELVSRIALLHDLFKMVSIKEFGTKTHGEAQITDEEKEFWTALKQKYAGFYEGDVAFITFKNDFPELALSLKKVSSPDEEKNFEEEIVHYADWRILKNQIVNLSERMDYLKSQYVKDDTVWERNERYIQRKENEIFAKLDFPPEELREKVK